MIRLSGPTSVELARQVFQPSTGAWPPAPNRAYVGTVGAGSEGEISDTAILTFFQAPRSYTGEDVVEISCHGSPVILSGLLSLLLALGARAAEPGEFTLRAFLNQRIDLAQAQAVRDLIDAQTAYQARLASRQLEGALSKKIETPKQSIVDVIVQMESTLEFVEDDISPDSAAALLSRLKQTIADLTEVAAGFAFGRYVKEGFSLAIIGRPNVGKSSIFNRLAGTDRAIVTEIPGTTRDTLHETTSISGIPVRLVDTAGIRETSDTVESIGISRSRAAIADADAVLLVLDATEPLTAADLTLLEEIGPETRIVLLNKIDLSNEYSEIGEVATIGGTSSNTRQEDDDRTEQTIPISALTGEGFDRLTEALIARLNGTQFAERDDVLVTDARQHASLRAAIENLKQAHDLLAQGELEEVVLLKLRAALSSLGEISGETLNDDILGQIFSTFCIGK